MWNFFLSFKKMFFVGFIVLVIGSIFFISRNKSPEVISVPNPKQEETPDPKQESTPKPKQEDNIKLEPKQGQIIKKVK